MSCANSFKNELDLFNNPPATRAKWAILIHLLGNIKTW